MSVEAPLPKLIVVVDTQYDFMLPDGALYVPQAEEIIVPGIRFLRNLKPEETAAVLFTFDTHDPEIYAVSEEAGQFPPHCVRGTQGWANVFNPALIDPAIPVHALEKGVFDLWAEPDVEVQRVGRSERRPRDTFFGALDPRRVQATVIGVAADYCVRWAVDGLAARGYRIEVPPELTRGIHSHAPPAVAAAWP
jgi:nicotinamidase/pyrazinamidase